MTFKEGLLSLTLAAYTFANNKWESAEYSILSWSDDRAGGLIDKIAHLPGQLPLGSWTPHVFFGLGATLIAPSKYLKLTIVGTLAILGGYEIGQAFFLPGIADPIDFLAGAGGVAAAYKMRDKSKTLEGVLQ